MTETKTFNLPDLGEGLVDATVTEWLVAEGDDVVLNQALCTVSTAKAEVELPSPFAGRIRRRHAESGAVVEVGAPLVSVETGGQGDDVPPVLVGYGPPPVPADAAAQRSIGPTPAAAGPVGGIPLRADRPTGPVAAPTPVPAGTSHPLAKPPVRALAKRLGVDLRSIGTGSGPRGVITRQDVEGAASRLDAPRPASPPPAGWSAATPEPESVAGTTLIPVRGVRAVIAERMTASRRDIPDAWCGRWIDAEAFAAQVEELRDRLDVQTAEAVTPFALMLRVVVAQLRRHPLLNSSFDSSAGVIRQFDAVHLGVAVADKRGLAVPVIRDADRLNGRSLALELRRLIDAVRSGTAKPDELQGSTFTVSNYGALGLDDGNPVINPPEAAILGIGSLRSRPVVVAGELAARRTVKMTCAFDHRIADGAQVGAFLSDVAASIEQPGRALLDL